jgi:hypothetical protein
MYCRMLDFKCLGHIMFLEEVVDRRKIMNEFNLEYLYIYQDLNNSISTISIMTDSTINAIDKMYTWKYKDKDEMKHLGGTIKQMEDKFIELSILGLSKMVEDFFNNLKRFGKIKLNVWDSSCDTILYSKEVRLIRHLANVIKHNNSIIDSSYGGKSIDALIIEYGFDDETPISWLNIFKPSTKDSILKYTYITNEFCYDVLKYNGFMSKSKKNLSDDEIIKYMYKHFIHSLPGHPKSELRNMISIWNEKRDKR